MMISSNEWFTRNLLMTSNNQIGLKRGGQVYLEHQKRFETRYFLEHNIHAGY